ncbi:hypothetical protein MMC09_004648 [Bachmanniomyces sp. S44760]|nr:hypothetical protein [Bachmanniomyces sp. S44760]
MANSHQHGVSEHGLPQDSPPAYEATEGDHAPRDGSHARTPRANRSLELLNEQSPLLSPQYALDEHDPLRRESTPADTLDYNDGPDEKSKSVWYLFLLTLSIGGLQIAWAVELSNGSPYLLSLGMSKSVLAFVWIAGPLSGTLVQPYVGIRSDNCRLSWGKRAPFMLAGTAATIVSLMALAWTRDIVQGFLGLFGADPTSKGVKVTAIVFAIIWVYVLDFAINTVQAGIRAFIVDNAPTHQQEDANAHAGRITGVGNILGYLSGYVDLPKIMPFFGDTQFKVLCVIACLALGGTVATSCFFIRERDPRLEGPPTHGKSGVISFFRQVFHSIKRLPPQIRRICDTQFFAWMGWFPFLFYITTYIGQLQVNPYLAENPNLSEEEIDKAWEQATRIGTFALLIFAITSFISNVLLPFLIVPTYRAPTEIAASHHRVTLSPGTPGEMSASMSGFFTPISSSESHSRLSRLFSSCQIPGLTLRRAWLLAHLVYALSMFSTFMVSTPVAGTVLVGFVGIPWALTLWAPFALISAEISKRDAARRARKAGRGSDEVVDEDGGYEEDQAGVILGLHNVAVSAPQIVATLVSSLIFKMAQRERGVPGDDSVAWTLRFGGCCALIAAYMTSRVEEEADTRQGHEYERV